MQKSIDYSSSLDATSDCVNPVLQLTVATANGIITSPGSTSWTDFGFPSNQVFLNSDYSGTVNGLSRACTRTYGDTISSDQWIYSCFDNGAYACSILIQQN